MARNYYYRAPRTLVHTANPWHPEGEHAVPAEEEGGRPVAEGVAVDSGLLRRSGLPSPDNACSEASSGSRARSGNSLRTPSRRDCDSLETCQ